jgi:hypothetical protein
MINGCGSNAALLPMVHSVGKRFNRIGDELKMAREINLRHIYLWDGKLISLEYSAIIIN